MRPRSLRCATLHGMGLKTQRSISGARALGPKHCFEPFYDVVLVHPYLVEDASRTRTHERHEVRVSCAVKHKGGTIEGTAPIAGSLAVNSTISTRMPGALWLAWKPAA